MHERLLVPVDGCEPSIRGLEEAIRLAAALGAALHLLHVIDPFPVLAERSPARNVQETWAHQQSQGHALLETSQARACRSGVRASAVIREARQASLAAVIAAESHREGCDLIVMGTHGRRGLDRLAQGSTTELLLRMSLVPVLIVRWSGHDRRATSPWPKPEVLA